jgi:signal peptidase I
MNESNQADQNKPGNDKLDMKELLDWAKYILGAFIIAFLISRFIIVNAYVPTESMVSTIMPKDRVIANRLSYLVKKPQRGDIVVFKFPDNESVAYVKRIIGVPGDTVSVKEGVVYINGNKQDEPYLKEPHSGNYGPFKVPEGRYFMMGDNRDNSRDSRFWENKYVARDKILGKVFVRYFPLNRMKLF